MHMLLYIRVLSQHVDDLDTGVISDTGMYPCYVLDDGGDDDDLSALLSNSNADTPKG